MVHKKKHVKKKMQTSRKKNYVNFEGARWTADDLAEYQANMAKYQKDIEKEFCGYRDEIARLKAELVKWYEMDKIKE